MPGDGEHGRFLVACRRPPGRTPLRSDARQGREGDLPILGHVRQGKPDVGQRNDPIQALQQPHRDVRDEGVVAGTGRETLDGLAHELNERFVQNDHLDLRVAFADRGDVALLAQVGLGGDERDGAVDSNGHSVRVFLE